MLPAFFIPMIERTVFGAVGLAGYLIFLCAGSSYNIQYCRGAQRPVLVACWALVGLAACFCVAAIPVSYMPKAGEPGFDPDSVFLKALRTLWYWLTGLLGLSAVLVACGAWRGWSNFLQDSGQHALPRSGMSLAALTPGVFHLYFIMGYVFVSDHSSLQTNFLLASFALALSISTAAVSKAQAASRCCIGDVAGSGL